MAELDPLRRVWAFSSKDAQLALMQSNLSGLAASGRSCDTSPSGPTLPKQVQLGMTPESTMVLYAVST